MIINHNISALNAHRLLTENADNNGKVLEKLSSGLRINRGADDAAGLAVSEKMRSQVRGMNMAYRNAQDGVSLVQTAEGYLQETTSALQRMRELAVQAANGVLHSEDRQHVQYEVEQLTNEVERIAQQSQFNKHNLFLGNFAPANESKGTEAPPAAGGAGASSSTAQGPTYETHGIPLHIGPNMDQRVIITIREMTASKLGIAEANQAAVSKENNDETKVKSKLDLTKPEGANKAIGDLDEALKMVTAERTKLGAYQNRLETAMRGIGVAAENLQASESRVRDTDMAKEMIDFVKLNILSQASTSMLAQSNLRPQLVLRVLG